jgi:hypothetical protein
MSATGKHDRIRQNQEGRISCLVNKPQDTLTWSHSSASALVRATDSATQSIWQLCRPHVAGAELSQLLLRSNANLHVRVTRAKPPPPFPALTVIPLDWLLASQLEELPSPELTRYIARQISRDGPGTVPTVDRRRPQRSLSHMSEALVRTSDFHEMDDS